MGGIAFFILILFVHVYSKSSITLNKRSLLDNWDASGLNGWYEKKERFRYHAPYRVLIDRHHLQTISQETVPEMSRKMKSDCSQAKMPFKYQDELLQQAKTNNNRGHIDNIYQLGAKEFVTRDCNGNSTRNHMHRRAICPW